MGSLNYLPLAIALDGVLLVSAAIIYRFRHKKWKLVRFPFSVLNYYLFFLPWILAVVIASIQTRDLRFFLTFLAFCLAGVIGETLSSLWWKIFFSKRFFVYNTESAFHGYTSWLNFVAWGAGGLLYLVLARAISGSSINAESFPALMFRGAGIFIAAIALTGGITLLLKGRTRWPLYLRYLLMCFPAFVLFGYCAVVDSSRYLIVAAAFGFLVCIAEYLFGKATQLFISKKLWTYNYFTFDSGHITPLSVVPFALFGFYFLFVYALVVQFFRS